VANGAPSLTPRIAASFYASLTVRSALAPTNCI
jgi:hypothetical protein